MKVNGIRISPARARVLLCHQAGKPILERGHLDFVRMYTDSAGVLRRIDFKPWAQDPQTFTVSPDTSCQVW